MLHACWNWNITGQIDIETIDVNLNNFTAKKIEESIKIFEPQKEYYSQEFNSLSMAELVPKDSKLLSLHPLLIDTIIRVRIWKLSATLRKTVA